MSSPSSDLPVPPSPPPPRIDGRYLLQELRNFFNLERGFFHTVKVLLVAPGSHVRDYLRVNRTRLVKPLVFIFVTSFIYTLCNRWFGFEDGYMGDARFDADKNPATTRILAWIPQNYAYANIIMALFIALGMKVLFRRSGYNLWEMLVLLCYLMGASMLVLAGFGIAESQSGYPLATIGGVVLVIYVPWAIGHFFSGGLVVNYLKALLAYILGMILFFISAIALGTFIDEVILR